MKTHSLLLLLLSFVQVVPLFGETPYKEERRVIYSSEAPERPYLLQPGHSLEQTVSFPKRAYPTRKFLRVTGGVKMPAPFQERGEEMFRRSEFFIDDNLDSVVTRKDCYSLYFKGENDAFERYAYFRVMGEALKPGKLTVHLPVVRRRQLTVDVKGRFGLELELYYKKPGRAAQDILILPTACCLCLSLSARESIRMSAILLHCPITWLALCCVQEEAVSVVNVAGSAPFGAEWQNCVACPFHQVCTESESGGLLGRM